MVEQSDRSPEVLSATSIIGDTVRNHQGEDLGDIEELMINLRDGCIAYAVLSFGGIAGLGDKLFAIPWKALQLRPEEHTFVLDVRKDKLENAPGPIWPILTGQTGSIPSTGSRVKN